MVRTLTMLLGCALAMTSLSTPSPARAQPTASAPLAVEITLVGPIAHDPTFPQRISSWFDAARYRVTVRTSPRLDVASVLSPGKRADVFVWVSTSENQVTHLYFARMHRESGQTKYLVRDLASAHGLDEIGREHVAQVLYFSSVALVEGQLESRRDELERSLKDDIASDGAVPKAEIEAPPAPRPVAPPAVPKAPPRAPGARVVFGIGYGAVLRGDEGFLHGPRASFAIRSGGPFGLRAAVQGALPSTREIGPFAVNLYGASFALGATFSQRLASWAELGVFAGPGLDLVHHAPSVADGRRLRAADGATDARPTAVSGVSLTMGRAPRVALVAELAVALGRTHYEIELDGQRHDIGAPWRLAPLLGLEVQF